MSRDADPVLSGMSGKIADFRLDGYIGQSANAVVYLALDERSGARAGKVALKVLAPELARDAAFRDQFLHESQAASAVDHPNIIPVYAAGDANGALYVAMRYVQGGDARSLLNRYGPLPFGMAWSIIVQAASALDAAHANGLIHRDVKPTNMLLDADGAAGPGAPRRRPARAPSAVPRRTGRRSGSGRPGSWPGPWPGRHRPRPAARAAGRSASAAAATRGRAAASRRRPAGTAASR